MTDIDKLSEALANLRTAGFVLGPAWEVAHELAQVHEGEAMFDRLHALLHRIEGDHVNAAYWYRRAGVRVSSQPFEDEASGMLADLDAGGA